MATRFILSFLLAGALAWPQLRPAQIIILIGPPGSGKSVQADLLSKTYKVPAISMESLVKREMGKKTSLAKALASSVASGELVSDDAANQVMKARLLRPDAGRGFILDGYPVTNDQAVALDAFLTEQSFPTPVVVVLEASDDVLRQRMKKRGRANDSAENVDRRIREYREREAFTQKRYGPDSTARVDGSGSVQTVALAIAQQIENARAKKGLLVRPPTEDGLKRR